MTVLVSNTANTSTFSYWLARTNELATAMSTQAVTTNSNTAVGNAAITGTFTANNIVVNNGISIGGTSANGSGIGVGTINAVSIGTTTLSANIISVGTATVNAVINATSYSLANSTTSLIITLPTSAQQAAQTYFLNANGSWGSLNTPISNSSINTVGTGSQVIDYYAMSSFRAASYFINVTDTISNNYYITNITTTHDGTTAYITEYGAILTNTAIGIFSSSSNTTHVQLVFTPITTGSTVKYSRILL